MFGKSVFNKLIILTFSLLSLSVFAQDQRPEKKSKGSQQGVVISHEAAVYAKPDFDSEVVGSLQENQKVLMSTRRFQSSADFGSFFRVRLPSGKIGYVADNDIQPAKLKKKFDDEMENQEAESLYFKKMVGGSLAQVNYSEMFQGKASKAQTTVFGFRLTGPDVIGDSPPLDINILVGIKPPGYYDTMSSGKATGFFLIGDLGLIFPLMDWTKSMLNFGVGLMWTYTNFKVPVASKTYDSSEFRMGIDLSFGGAYRFGDLVVRGDVKYFIEKTQYTGLVLSLQKIY